MARGMLNPDASYHTLEIQWDQYSKAYVHAQATAAHGIGFYKLIPTYEGWQIEEVATDSGSTKFMMGYVNKAIAAADDWAEVQVAGLVEDAHCTETGISGGTALASSEGDHLYIQNDDTIEHETVTLGWIEHEKHFAVTLEAEASSVADVFLFPYFIAESA